MRELRPPSAHQPAPERSAPDLGANERELVKELQSGDPKAIETLYTMYFDRLYAFIFNSVKRDQSAAEDIVHDIFESVIRGTKGFKGQSKIYTWLAGIAHHKIADYYRREQREIHHNNPLITDNTVDSQSIADDSQSISDGLMYSEMGHVFAGALSGLPPDYRQALLLKYVEEMTVAEISQVMNRSPKSIDGLLTRARKLLKESFSGEL